MKGRTILSAFVAALVVLVVATGATAQSPVSEFDTILVENVVATDDVIVGDDLTVTGSATFSGGLAVGATVTADTVAADIGATMLYITPGASITVTSGSTITPTASLHRLTSSGNVGTGSLASGQDGQILTLINSSNTTITITDTTGLILSGNAALAQNDTITLVWYGAAWYEIAQTDN